MQRGQRRPEKAAGWVGLRFVNAHSLDSLPFVFGQVVYSRFKNKKRSVPLFRVWPVHLCVLVVLF